MTLYLTGRVAGHRMCWPLNGPSHRVGRAIDNDVQVADPTVSKHHARITVEAGVCVVADLASRNGTRVNGHPAGDGVTLAAGDRVEFGHVTFEVDDRERGDAPGDEPVHAAASLSIPAGQLLARLRSEPDAGARAVHLLAEAGRLLVQPKTLDASFEQILAIVERAVTSSRIVLLLGDGGAPRPVASRSRGRATDAPLQLSRTILRQVLEERTSVLVQDAPADPRYQTQQSIVAERVHTAIAVPLIDGDRVLGLLYVDHNDAGPAYGGRELEIVTLLANMAAAKITHARLLEAEARHARIEQELAMAREIQLTILPESPPAPAGYRGWAHLQSCHEVGGDLYDWFETPGGAVYLLIGDVVGKGLGAALLMSSVVTSARMLYEDSPTPAELARRLNAMIHRSTHTGLFVTAIVGRLDPATHRLTFVNAGHPRPIVIEPGAYVYELDDAGIPLGVAADGRHVEQTLELAPGALVAFYTDGITEAERDREFFGVDGLIGALTASSGAPEQRCRDTLATLTSFRDGRPPEDDLTLILLERS